MWLEMSRDEEHGGSGWAFSECLWSPSHKAPSGRWPYWEALLRVEEGDLVFHLRGRTHAAAFVGFSVADGAGYETRRRPKILKKYEYAESFYRVPLRDFSPFPDPVRLDDVIATQGSRIADYLKRNRAKSPEDRKRIFLTQQAGRVQCLNGAYLSEFHGELGELMLGPDFTGTSGGTRPVFVSTATGYEIAQAGRRIGQDRFSKNVRANYGHRCCFPDCLIDEDQFLVGSHIARWSDAPQLRGETSNGLCLCLFHDRAFELGFFTLTGDYRVYVNQDKAGLSRWSRDSLLPHDGVPVRLGAIKPSMEALAMHWERIGVAPEEMRGFA